MVQLPQNNTIYNDTPIGTVQYGQRSNERARHSPATAGNSFNKSYIVQFLLSPVKPNRGNGSSALNAEREKITTEGLGTMHRFKFTPHGSSIEIFREIRELKCLRSADLLQWSDHFRQTVQLCGWDDGTATTVLKAVVSAEILTLIETKNTAEGVLQALCEIKYPPQSRFTYSEAMDHVKQAGFYTIAEYEHTLKRAFREYSLCNNSRGDFQDREFEIIFFKGLHGIVRIELAKLDITTYHQAMAWLLNVENIIMQKSEECIELVDTKKQGESKRVWTPTTARETKATKYCSRHGSGGHDTKDCLALKRGLPQRDYNQLNNKKPSSYIIREVLFPQNQGLIFDGRINNQNIKLHLDTGATVSYISTQKVKELQTKPLLLDQPFNVIIANGSTHHITSYIEEEIYFLRLPNKKIPTRIYIVDGELSHLLLGEQFLYEHEVLIDYKERRVRIADIWMYMQPTAEEWMTNPDSTIAAKAMAIQQTEDHLIPTHIQELITKASQPKSHLPKLKGCEMSITVTSKNPIVRKPYPIPNQIRDALDNEIKRLLDLGIITHSKSEYASPAFPILKRNGNIRLIVDYRQINKITQKDAYPFPNLWEEIRSIPQSKYFTQIDLQMGYHQIAIHPNSRKYTSFVIPGGQYEYCRIPFGLSNAPRIFQKAMQSLLGEFKFVKIFLDDILIFSPDKEKHTIHVQTVMDILEQNCVTINIDKSSFFKTEVSYLGHIINHQGIKADSTRVKDLASFTTPKTLKQVQRLIGYINWFRPYIPKLSSQLKPITNKLSHAKTKQFDWGESDHKIIESIFKEMTKTMTLSYPDYTKDFILETDASDDGMGAILYQEDRILGIFSRKFTEVQARYTVSEKELLAIITALEYFKTIIYLSKIKIKTDHANILTDTVNTTRFQRWKILLSEYDVEIVHIPGTTNIVADQLSRCFAISNAKINDVSDETLTLNNLHEKFCHAGTETIYRTIKNIVPIQNLKNKLNIIRRKCSICQQFMITSYHYGKVEGGLATATPFKDISTDIYGPIKSHLFNHPTDKGSFYLLTISDRCTRWTHTYPLYDMSSEEIIEHLKTWIRKNGTPDTCLSDCGRQYISHKFNTFLDARNIKHLYSTPYNPQGNSISERINQTITRVLRTQINCKLKPTLLKLNWVLQNQHHRVMKCSAYEARFGCSQLDPTRTPIPNVLQTAIDRSQQQLLADNKRTNTKRKEHRYMPNDIVYYQLRPTTKLDPLWEGPYKVKESSQNGNLITIENESRTIRTNVKQLRPL